MVAMWGTGNFERVLNPDMPWNEEIRATWARMERLAASPGPVALMLPLVSEMDVRALLPTVRVPTLVVQHADDPLIRPRWASTSQITYPARSTSNCRGATCTTSLNRGDPSFQEIDEFLTGHQAEVADDRVLAHSALHRHRGLDAPRGGDRRP